MQEKTVQATPLPGLTCRLEEFGQARLQDPCVPSAPIYKPLDSWDAESRRRRRGKKEGRLDLTFFFSFLKALRV